MPCDRRSGWKQRIDMLALHRYLPVWTARVRKPIVRPCCEADRPTLAITYVVFAGEYADND